MKPGVEENVHEEACYGQPDCSSSGSVGSTRARNDRSKREQSARMGF